MNHIVVISTRFKIIMDFVTKSMLHTSVLLKGTVITVITVDAFIMNPGRVYRQCSVVVTLGLHKQKLIQLLQYSIPWSADYLRRQDIRVRYLTICSFTYKALVFYITWAMIPFFIFLKISSLLPSMSGISLMERVPSSWIVHENCNFIRSHGLGSVALGWHTTSCYVNIEHPFIPAVALFLSDPIVRTNASFIMKKA
jgi:hypothetical protein